MKLIQICSFSILLIMCFLYKKTYAQEVLSSSGSQLNTNNIDLSWTLGEPAVQSFNQGNTQLKEGFHQVDLIVVSIHSYNTTKQINVFPNPTSHELTIKVSEDLNSWRFKIVDVNNKLLIEQKSDEVSSFKKIDVSSLSMGNYFLQVIQNDQIISSIKFIKTK